VAEAIEGRFFPFRKWLHQHFPHIFPDLIIAGFDQLTLETIQDLDIGALIVDVSGTLIPSLNHQPGNQLLEKLIRINNQIPIILVSDLLLPWQGARVKEIAERVDCYYLTDWPFPKITGRPLSKALDRLTPIGSNKIALIGDGRFRDIWPGNRLGFFTILIKELLPGCGSIKRWRKATGRWLRSLIFGI
jgi:uncharacterized protein